MLNYKSHNFIKKAQSNIKDKYNECIAIMEDLKNKKISIVTGAVTSAGQPKPHPNTWICVANEARDANNIDALDALIDVLKEAQALQGVKKTNVQSLKSYSRLLPYLSTLGTRKIDD